MLDGGGAVSIDDIYQTAGMKICDRTTAARSLVIMERLGILRRVFSGKGGVLFERVTNPEPLYLFSKTGEKPTRIELPRSLEIAAAVRRVEENLRALVIRVIERNCGKLQVNEVVHCFQDSADVTVSGTIIRKIEASRIQDAQDVKVVFFKTALSTGWDCPRAEVMMSFRTAEDPTSIAQLVGRMVRTPLARRIGTNELLDTVELFLPHYDRQSVEAVLERLRSPTDGVSVRAEIAATIYPRNPAFEEAFEFLQQLPTATVASVPRMNDIRRVLRLAGLLMHEGIDEDADERTRLALLKRMHSLRDHYAATVENWNGLLREGGEIEVDALKVVIGPMTISDTLTTRLTLSEENIDQLFESAGRVLAAGEGLHRTYWKTYHAPDSPNAAKLELVGIIEQPKTIRELEELAQELFAALWEKHLRAIQKLPAAARQKFTLLCQSAGVPSFAPWQLAEQILEKPEGSAWTHHLYADDSGSFSTSLNGWEREFLESEFKGAGFVGWLRNLPRREWAFCVPYQMGGVWKPFYPDLIILRRERGALVVDVIEPHSDAYADAIPKAIGFAKFAAEHGQRFGRLVFARKKGDRWQPADMNDKATRTRTAELSPSSSIEALFTP